MNEEERREEQQEPVELPAAPPEQGPVLMRQALEAERKALDEERAAFAAQRLEDAVGRELASRGLPTAFAGFLTGRDEAQALEQVELFEALFRESLSQAVTERMRGTHVPKEPARGRSYSRESLRGMSRREINEHWEEITRALAR